MKHKWIDKTILHDFSDGLSWGDVFNELDLKLTNVYDEEALTYLVNAIYDDYEKGWANYRAYLEDGVDARMFMELRKSAVIPVPEPDWDRFFTKHQEFDTADEVRAFRADYFKYLNSDYDEYNWQYYTLIQMTRKDYGDFEFDFEDCFTDGDPSKQSHVEDYAKDRMQMRYETSIKNIPVW